MMTGKGGSIGGIVKRVSGFQILPCAPEGHDYKCSFAALASKQANGKDYQYLKTGDEVDRSGKHGKCRRVEEWKGAEKWDNEIYTSY
ncbi:MAG: hypothetical protein LBS59_09185 [Puniceicoccales bacterium]|jgi:hypothetical protein|nr:hypothetical protein [Puniceicoccales bacterium]